MSKLCKLKEAQLYDNIAFVHVINAVNGDALLPLTPVPCIDVLSHTAKKLNVDARYKVNFIIGDELVGKARDGISDIVLNVQEVSIYN